MRKLALILVVAFCFGTGLLLAAQTGKSAWKGTVATEDGVKVVKNPSEPLYGEFVFDLKEDLRLGGDPEKEASYFPKGAWLSVDAAGNLIVSDIGNRRVQMFDKNGAFVRAIGRQGQGPGEYMFPGGIYFDADGNIWVDGGRGMVVFSKDGLFVRNVSVANSLMRKLVHRHDPAFARARRPETRTDQGRTRWEDLADDSRVPQRAQPGEGGHRFPLLQHLDQLRAGLGGLVRLRLQWRI
jgi:hypothetical protein